MPHSITIKTMQASSQNEKIKPKTEDVDLEQVLIVTKDGVF